MSELPDEAREVYPVILHKFKDDSGFRDFAPHPISSSAPDEALPIPVPKGESALASVASSLSPQSDVQIESETNAQTPASKVNGKDSEPSEPTTTDETTAPESSSPDSSSTQNPGWKEPTVEVVPPTNDKAPKL
jgi:hypothetical protein